MLSPPGILRYTASFDYLSLQAWRIVMEAAAYTPLGFSTVWSNGLSLELHQMSWEA
jgi:hypothetical protein